MEACLVPLRPQSLAEWADTDMAWWHELAAAKAAWQEGRETTAATRQAIQQATAHMRTPKR
jgi:hypothetical protein